MCMEAGGPGHYDLKATDCIRPALSAIELSDTDWGEVMPKDKRVEYTMENY